MMRDSDISPVCKTKCAWFVIKQNPLRIPGEADRDSVLMPTAIPESCRPGFRWEADRNSGACRPVF